MTNKKAVYSICGVVVLVVAIAALSSGGFGKLWDRLTGAAINSQKNASINTPKKTYDTYFDSTGAEMDPVKNNSLLGSTSPKNIEISGRHYSLEELKSMPGQSFSTLDYDYAQGFAADGVFLQRPGDSVGKVAADAKKSKQSGAEIKQATDSRRAQIAADHSKAISQIEGITKKHLVKGKAGKGQLAYEDFSDTVNGILVKGIPVKDAQEKLKDVSSNISPNYFTHANLVQSIPLIQADKVWQQFSGTSPIDGTGVKVGIVDTGVDYTRSYLGGCFGAGCKVAGGYNIGDGNSNPMDTTGHGTILATAVAGSGQYVGVAPGAKIYAYKVTQGSSQSADISSVVSGIQRCMDPNKDGDYSDHLDVCLVAFSVPDFWGGNPDDVLSQTVDAAVANGVIVVTAAGDSFSVFGKPDFTGYKYIGTIESPGMARNGITVGASCKPGDTNYYCSGVSIAKFSPRGPVTWSGTGSPMTKPDVVAPGVNIVAAGATSSGTSISAALVAGAAALVHQAFPTMLPLDVKSLLMKTAVPYAGYTANDQGAGLINMSAAIGNNTNTQLVDIKGDVPVSIDDVVKNATQSYTKNISITNKTASSMIFSTPTLTADSTGITVTSTPSSFTIVAGQTQNVALTLSLDNTKLTQGYHSGVITYSTNQGNVTLGFSLTVKDRIAISSNLLDYDLDTPGLATWQSSKSITLTNSTLSSQTYTLSTASGNANIILSTNPTSLTIPAGGTATVSVAISATNASLGNGRYDGTVTVTSSQVNDAGIPVQKSVVKTTFYKGYKLNFNFTNTPPMLTQLYTEDGIGYQFINGPLPSQTFYAPVAGQWWVDSYWPGPNQNDFMYSVIKSVTLNDQSAIGTVSEDKSEASHKVTFAPTYPSGNPMTTASEGYFYLIDRSSGRGFNFAYEAGGVDYPGSFSLPLTLHVNDLDSTHKILFEITSEDTAGDGSMVEHQYQLENGVTSDLTLTNTPADFNKIEIDAATHNPNTINLLTGISACLSHKYQTVMLRPYLGTNLDSEVGNSVNHRWWICLGNDPDFHSEAFLFGPTLSLSNLKTYFYSYHYGGTDPSQEQYPDYAMVKFMYVENDGGPDALWDPNSSFKGQSYNYYVDKGGKLWPTSFPSEAHVGLINSRPWPEANFWKYFGFPTPPGNKIYLNWGPVFDSTLLLSYQSNSPYFMVNHRVGYSEYSDSGYSGSFGTKYGSARGGSVTGAGTYSLVSNYTLSGTWGPCEPSDDENCLGVDALSKSKTITINKPVWYNGIQTQSVTRSTFSSRNYPPLMKSLHLIANNQWQNLIDPNMQNQLSFGLDPNPTPSGSCDYYSINCPPSTESITQQSLEVSTDNGTTWTTIPTTATGNTNEYIGTVPVTPGITLYTFRVSATDSTTSTYSYQFQIPTSAPQTTTGPVITSFTATPSNEFLMANITSFTAADSAAAITGYYVSRSPNTPPLVITDGDVDQWSSTPKTTYLVAAGLLERDPNKFDPGIKTLYAWVKDANGNISPRVSFDFPCINSAPPVMSGVNPLIYSSDIWVLWNTNIPTYTYIDYGLTSSYTGTDRNTKQVLSTDGQGSTLAPLTPNTTYHFRAVSQDFCGNTSTSGDLVGTTKPASDTTPPTVSLTTPTNGATLSGTTTITATASDNVGVDHVDFYRDTTLISTDTSSPYSASWDTTSVANGTYSLTAKAYDAAGNATTSSSISVTVNNTPADTTPPVISSVATSSITSSGATITWTTNEPADTQVFYGTVSGSYPNSSMLNPLLTTAHSVTISLLTATTKYYFVPTSKDAAGNKASGAENNFTTTALPDTTAPTTTFTAASNTWTNAAVSRILTCTDTGGSLCKNTYWAFITAGTACSLTITPGAACSSTGYTQGNSASCNVQGTWRLCAYSTDNAGNIETPKYTESFKIDIKAPTVSIASPTSGSTVSGTSVSLSANASDDLSGISSVQFAIDGVNVGSPDTTTPYSTTWNSTTVGNGSHAVTAKAIDLAGNVSLISSVTFTVSNSTANAPTVTINSPQDGTRINSNKGVVIKASAQSTIGIASISLYANNSLVYKCSFTTYLTSNSCSVTAYHVTTGTISAIATDKNGVSSPKVSVTVK